MRDKFLPRELSVVSEVRHVNIIRMHHVLHCKMACIDKVLIVTGNAFDSITTSLSSFRSSQQIWPTVETS